MQVGGAVRAPGDRQEPVPSPQAHPQPQRVGQEPAVGGDEVGLGLGQRGRRRRRRGGLRERTRLARPRRNDAAPLGRGRGQPHEGGRVGYDGRATQRVAGGGGARVRVP